MGLGTDRVDTYRISADTNDARRMMSGGLNPTTTSDEMIESIWADFSQAIQYTLCLKKKHVTTFFAIT